MCRLECVAWLSVFKACCIWSRLEKLFGLCSPGLAQRNYSARDVVLPCGFDLFRISNHAMQIIHLFTFEVTHTFDYRSWVSTLCRLGSIYTKGVCILASYFSAFDSIFPLAIVWHKLHDNLVVLIGPILCFVNRLTTWYRLWSPKSFANRLYFINHKLTTWTIWFALASYHIVSLVRDLM